MSKRYLGKRISMDNIKSSILHQWESLKFLPSEKTYYISDTFSRWAKESNTNKLFLLKVLIDLNEQTVYEKEEDKKEMLELLYSKVKELG